MITIFIRNLHQYTIKPFLATWGHQIASEVEIIPYEFLYRINSIRGNVVIFTDLERLSSLEMKLAAAFCNKLKRRNEIDLVMNHPGRVLKRMELSAILSENGINDFACYPIGNYSKVRRYPVFIRSRHDHEGSLSPILKNELELQQALAAISRKRRLRNDLIVVELLDGAEDGVYRKYSAMRIGDKILPRHVLCSSNWVTKTPDIVNVDTAKAELEYIDTFPHKEFIQKVFEIANIEFGRIDYGIIDGRIQVWEINTNPVVIPVKSKIAPERIEGQTKSAQLIVDAFRMLTEQDISQEEYSINSPAPKLLAASIRFRNLAQKLFPALIQ